jgi:hypothetical protein
MARTENPRVGGSIPSLATNKNQFEIESRETVIFLFPLSLPLRASQTSSVRLHFTPRNAPQLQIRL